MPVSTDLDPQRLRCGIERAHRDRAVFGREFRSVFQHVPEHLLQAGVIREHAMIFRGELDRELELSRRNFVAHDFHGVFSNSCALDLRRCSWSLPASDAGEIEEIVDEARLKLDVAADHPQAFVDLGGSAGSSAMPPAQIRIGVRGVRSSWLSTARKRSLAALADSAASFCRFNSVSDRRR